MLRTVDHATAAVRVEFLSVQAPIDLPGAYAVQWRAGRNSEFRNVNVLSRSTFGYGGRPGKPNGPDTHLPLVRIEGNGGGRWYNFYQESAWKQLPGYRHLLVEGTTEPLRFYQLNPEHAHSDANVEIRNAHNVEVYGIKGEGNYAVLWIRDSDHVNVYGYGGNASAFPAADGYPTGFAQFTPSLIRVERTPNFRLVNIVDYGRMSGHHAVFGQGYNANDWHAVLDIPLNGGAQVTAALDRPVLVKRSD